MMQKRFQFFSKDGKVKWSRWFPYNGNSFEKIQFKGKNIVLKNEYKNFIITKI